MRIYSNTDLLATSISQAWHPLLMVCLQTTDAPEEWFFNETEKKLCEQHASEADPHTRACHAERGCARADYFFNSTSPPTGEEKFVATKTKVLFNVSAAAPFAPSF